MKLSDSLDTIPRIGSVYQARLKKLGITTVRDLLFHFPRTYEDLSEIHPISSIKEGGNYCIGGKILDIQNIKTFKKKMSVTEAVVEDETGSIKVIWFRQPYLTQTLKKGDVVYLAGKVIRDKYGTAFSNPSYEKISLEDMQDTAHTGRIIPIYQEVRGVSSRWLRSVIKPLLTKIPQDLKDSLPDYIAKEQGFVPLKEAIKHIHFPESLSEAEIAKRRFSFEELFLISLFVLTERKKLASVKAVAIPFDETRMKRFTFSLSFELTDAQKKAAWYILKDLEKPRPMNRLLQGDVGSGKTVVAAMAALSAVKAGYQVAFMAPTEILVQQHFRTLQQLLSKQKVSIGILTGKTDRYTSPRLPNDYVEISRTKLLEKAKKGDIDVLVGTHALIQDKVKFGKLALVVVDEQHRFGVKQRAQMLHRTKLIPHLLSMTATPIPRTLALTIYGDLDLTLIDELPEGRKKIETKIIPPAKREEAYEFIRKQVKKGRQVFVICPRIEKSEGGLSGIELKTVIEEHEKLSQKIFPNLAVAMLHGKMKQKEKEQVMRHMKYGKTDILVSTSVVEVGVDIPNATVMMIEGADRFGLAQLHQFRGRVGRREHQSYCFLFTESPSTTTRERLKALVKSESGFDLAEHDLRIRGPGDFSGVKQWGMPDFVMEQLTNLKLVEQAREAAKDLLDRDIALKNYPQLAREIQELREKLHLE